MKFTQILALVATATAAQAFVVPRQNSTAGATGGNLQPFSGSLGGAATPVLQTGDAKRPFSVKGDTFVNLKGALQRSCDQQFNACANQANSGAADITVDDCSQQKTECTAADANVQAPAN